MNIIDNIDYNLAEASDYFTILDSSHLIDAMGVLPYLRSVIPTMNNPQEQHVLKQLLAVAEAYEHVLLKMEPADKVLEVRQHV